MAVSIRTVRALVAKALLDEPTGDTFLDKAYNEYTEQVGHTNPYYRLIYLLARRYQPSCYVELGVHTGVALSHAAVGAPNCLCIGVDSWADWDEAHRQAREKEEHYSNIRIVRAWSIPEAAQRWIDLHLGLSRELESYHLSISDASSFVPQSIDMLFIDSWHEEEFALKEWEVYGARVPTRGFVLCDDVQGDASYAPGMDNFWKTISEKKRHVFSGKLHPGYSFGVLIK